MEKKKNVLIVGAGLYGSIVAKELASSCNVLVIDKRDHIGGNCFTKEIDGIHEHVYGPHIFHTNDKFIWNWISDLVELEQFQFSPVADYHGERFSLPFNLWTFHQVWQLSKLEDIRKKYDEIIRNGKRNPKNLEEQAISLVGIEVYNKLIKGYTEKQWGRKATSLPASIIKRLPVRFTYNNNYFNDQFQGIPKEGYTKLFEVLLNNIDVHLGVDFFENRSFYEKEYDLIVYTGQIDQLYEYCFGKLDYRSLKWDRSILQKDSVQGTAVVNYTGTDVKYTRIIEHKHFLKSSAKSKSTIISKEYPQDYDGDNEPFYPVNDTRNQEIYNKYKNLAEASSLYWFGGRLGRYKYYDMHQVIASALSDITKIKERL